MSIVIGTRDSYYLTHLRLPIWSSPRRKTSVRQLLPLIAYRNYFPAITRLARLIDDLSADTPNALLAQKDRTVRVDPSSLYATIVEIIATHESQASGFEIPLAAAVESSWKCRLPSPFQTREYRYPWGDFGVPRPARSPRRVRASGPGQSDRNTRESPGCTVTSERRPIFRERPIRRGSRTRM